MQGAQARARLSRGARLPLRSCIGGHRLVCAADAGRAGAPRACAVAQFRTRRSAPARSAAWTCATDSAGLRALCSSGSRGSLALFARSADQRSRRRGGVRAGGWRSGLLSADVADAKMATASRPNLGECHRNRDGRRLRRDHADEPHRRELHGPDSGHVGFVPATRRERATRRTRAPWGAPDPASCIGVSRPPGSATSGRSV